MRSERALNQPPPIVAVDESICRLSYVIDNHADRIIVLMPRNTAVIGVLGYIFATKLVHSKLLVILCA